jgi:hypothetical protein
MPCPVPGLRSPHAAVRGLVHFPRLLDKARLMASGRLPADYHAALGRGFDRRVCEALRIRYEDLAAEAVRRPEASDEALLAWAECRGRSLTEGDIEVLSAFLSKRGWRDDAEATFVRRRSEAGAPEGLLTYFELIDWDEGR